MATATVTAITSDLIVTATVYETFRARSDDNMSGPYAFATEPTDAEVIAYALGQSVIYPTNARDVTEVTNRQTIEAELPYTAQIRQFNWQDLDRTVELRIPASELPADYTNDDVIAWGRANGKLLPAVEV